MTISIVIPVKNGVGTLRKCLDGWYAQTISDQLEVIVIDSGSKDGTLELLNEYPVRLFRILPEEFNHGATRNLGVAKATGELVFFTVQDAWPVNQELLERMATYFKDPEVAGVCGQQIVPHNPEFNPLEWFRPINKGDVRMYQFRNQKEFQELSPEEQRWVCGWDDVIAMYRTTVINKKLPFGHINFGEDMDWAHRAILKGYKLIYDTNLRVNHYHHHTADQMYLRKLREVELEFQQFGLIPEADFHLFEFLKVLYRGVKYRVKPWWILYNWSKHYQEYRAKKSFLNKVINESNN